MINVILLRYAPFCKVCLNRRPRCSLSYPPAESRLARVCADAILPAIIEGLTQIIATATRAVHQTAAVTALELP